MQMVYYNNVDIPLTAQLLKTISMRVWVGKDGTITRPLLINTMDGLSPFKMMKMLFLMRRPSPVSLTFASSVNSLMRWCWRKQKTSPLVLKGFANFLFASFSDHCLLFKCMHELVRAFKAYSYRAWKQLSDASKDSILWIVLLQSCQFSNIVSPIVLLPRQGLLRATICHPCREIVYRGTILHNCVSRWMVSYWDSMRWKTVGFTSNTVTLLPSVTTFDSHMGIQTLQLLLHHCRAPTSLYHVVDKQNKMANVISRAFKNGKFYHAANNLPAFLNTAFPLQQNVGILT